MAQVLLPKKNIFFKPLKLTNTMDKFLAFVSDVFLSYLCMGIFFMLKSLGKCYHLCQSSITKCCFTNSRLCLSNNWWPESCIFYVNGTWFRRNIRYWWTILILDLGSQRMSRGSFRLEFQMFHFLMLESRRNDTTCDNHRQRHPILSFADTAGRLIPKKIHLRVHLE